VPPSPIDNRTRWTFVGVSAVAGALAAPPSWIATPVSAAIAGLTAFLGLSLWRWSGLPQVVRSPWPAGGRRWLRVLACYAIGLLAGLVLLGVIRLAIEPAVPSMGERMATAGAQPVWRRLLIIYVAAVGEELLFRLVIMSLTAGVLARLVRALAGPPSAAIVWTSNVVASVAFAAAHLPSWSSVDSPGPWLTLSVLALNAAGGLLLGYIFATRGIVAAMIAHSGADSAIQLIGPLTG
jgi:CAAX prenyl protease-like protein